MSMPPDSLPPDSGHAPSARRLKGIVLIVLLVLTPVGTAYLVYSQFSPTPLPADERRNPPTPPLVVATPLPSPGASVPPLGSLPPPSPLQLPPPTFAVEERPKPEAVTKFVAPARPWDMPP